MKTSPCWGCPYEFLQKKYCMDHCEMIGRVTARPESSMIDPLPVKPRHLHSSGAKGAARVIRLRDLGCFGNRVENIAAETGNRAGAV